MDDATTAAASRLPSALAGTRSTLRKRSGTSRHPDDSEPGSATLAAATGTHLDAYTIIRDRSTTGTIPYSGSAAQSLFPPPTRKRVSFVDPVRIEPSPSFSAVSQRAQTIATTSQSYSVVAGESWKRQTGANQRSRTGSGSATSLALTHHAHKFPLPQTPPDELETRKWVLGLGIELQSWGAWTIFKWCLLASVLSVFVYGMTGLILGLMLWLHAFEDADVFAATNPDIVAYLIIAAVVTFLTSLIGITGVLLNARPLLALYSVLLVSCFITLILPAYRAYDRANMNLEAKMNLAWSQWWAPPSAVRLTVQNGLRCCGYFTPQYQAIYTRQCYPRAPPPIPGRGCKAPLLHFQTNALRRTYRTFFSIAGLHLVNFTAALVCSNHVTRTFGKGLTPRNYRLTAQDVTDNASMLVAHLQRQAELYNDCDHPSSCDAQVDHAGAVPRLAQLTRSRSHAMERDDVRQPTTSITQRAKLTRDGTWSAKSILKLLNETRITPSHSRGSNDALLFALERDRSNMGWGRAAPPAIPSPYDSDTPTRLVLTNPAPRPSRTPSRSPERPSSANESDVSQASATTVVGSQNNDVSLPARKLPSPITAPLQPRRVGRPLPTTPDDERLRVPLKVPEASRTSFTTSVVLRDDEERLASGGGSGQRSWARTMFDAGGSQGSETGLTSEV